MQPARQVRLGDILNDRRLDDALTTITAGIDAYNTSGGPFTRLSPELDAELTTATAERMDRLNDLALSILDEELPAPPRTVDADTVRASVTRRARPARRPRP